MQLNSYLIDTFSYNNQTNKKLLDKIKLLKDNAEAVKLFSHLINCQVKWMARVTQDPNAIKLSWWEPIYDFDKLAGEWTKSLNPWLKYITQKTEEELSSEITFVGFDNVKWAVTPKDIALQLNYHSIHHRAQIQTILRQQGIEPDFVDYIGTKYRKLSGTS